MPPPAQAVSAEALSLYARRIAHDLNNFSTVVRTYSELLLSELPTDSSTYSDIAEIQRAAENMVQYISRVTRFARVASLRMCAVDVSSGIAQAVERLCAEHPGRKIVMELAPGALISADPVWWKDVILELLLNAHEAAPPESPVIVSVQVAGDWIETTVADLGNGISEELNGRAMEPFVTTKQGVRGAGMGLTLARAFAEAAGGSISISRYANQTRATMRMCIA